MARDRAALAATSIAVFSAGAYAFPGPRGTASFSAFRRRSRVRMTSPASPSNRRRKPTSSLIVFGAALSRSVP
jgi:hypothetical protein